MTENTSQKDYLSNWTLNIPKKSAAHKSGVEFKYISQGEEGKPRLKISNMPKWFSEQMAEGKTSKDCYEELEKLSGQFLSIANDIILPALHEQEKQLKNLRKEYDR